MISCAPSLPLLIFLICSSSYLCFNVQARRLQLPPGHPERESEEKVMMGGKIGSRPPVCQRRCSSSCQQCEAIQVPTNPQKKNGNKKLSSSPPSSSPYSRTAGTSTSAMADDNYSSNYKPMSWKCKCGNLIFNP